MQPRDDDLCAHCDKPVNLKSRSGERATKLNKWVSYTVTCRAVEGLETQDKVVWYCSPRCYNNSCRFMAALVQAWQSCKDSGQASIGVCTCCHRDLYEDLNQQIGEDRFCSPQCTAAYDRTVYGAIRAKNTEMLQALGSKTK